MIYGRAQSLTTTRRGRSFLKLASLTVVSKKSGKTVQPNIKKLDHVPTLKKASTAMIDANDHLNPLSYRTSVNHANHRDAGQSETSSNEILSLLGEQRKDINRIVNCVEELQAQILTVQNEHQDLQRNRKALGQISSTNFDFSEEIGILTENVSTIGGKVNEIDGFKLELKMMKRRIQRLEDGNMSTQSTHTVTGLTQDTPRATFAKMTGSLARRPISVGKGAPHHDDENNIIGPAAANDKMDLSLPILSAVKDRRKFGEVSLQRQNINQTKGVPEVQDPPDLSKLGAGRSIMATNPVLPHSEITREERDPTLDGINPVMSAKALQGLRNLAKLPSRPTSGIFLNNHQMIPRSDSEDNDYDPNSEQETTPRKGQLRNSNRIRGSGHGHRRSAPIRLPTPEWEKPDWVGPPGESTSAIRGRGIMRRGVSGRNRVAEPDPKRRKTTSNDPDLQNDSHVNDSEVPSVAQESRPFKTPTIGKRSKKVLPAHPRSKKHGQSNARSTERERDEHGHLLKRDGKIDGRTLRALKLKKDNDTTEADPKVVIDDDDRGERSEAEREVVVTASTKDKAPKTKKRSQERASN